MTLNYSNTSDNYYEPGEDELSAPRGNVADYDYDDTPIYYHE